MVLNALNLGSFLTALDTTVPVIDADDWSSVMTALENQISVSNVVGVLAVIAGACVGFAFMWWGVRKATSALFRAFKKGKVSL